jgi:predicted O-methyltransferase YrrM
MISPALLELRRELLRDQNPYDAADGAWIDTGYPHTFLPLELVELLLRRLRPALWLELGSMVGGSAIRTAAAAARLELETAVVCVDPFVGDVNAWEYQDHPWDCLRIEQGRPHVYERFIANVAAAGHRDRILPLVMTSAVATRLLERLHAAGRLTARPSVAYLDSAHEAGETLLELRGAWSALAPGGVLFGDDWDWPAVRDDVTEFARTAARSVDGERELREVLPGAELLDGVLVYRNQWLLQRGER